MTGNGSSPLRAALDAVIAERGCSLKDLTVLAPQRDPFRRDTPANHRLGEWLAAAMGTLGLTGRKIHPRGLHYAMLGQPKPDGKPGGLRVHPPRTPCLHVGWHRR